jgi:hypothetical protein
MKNISNTNKLLVGVVIILIAVIVIVRNLFGAGFSDFKNRIADLENNQYQAFINSRDSMTLDLRKSDALLAGKFAEAFDPEMAFVKVDTQYSYGYLTEKIEYKLYSTAYLNCLMQKCLAEAGNEEVVKKMKLKETEFEKKFDSLFTKWYPIMKGRLLNLDSVASSGCGDFHLQIITNSYSEDRWNDFRSFLRAYQQDLLAAKGSSAKANSTLEAKKSATKSQLNKAERKDFEDQIQAKSNEILISVPMSKSFHGNSLGEIDYSLTESKFVEESYEKVSGAAMQRHWAKNSLRTGAMPYSNCYGSSNSCGGYGCSKIQVRNGGSDVVVTVKNQKGKVCRHGYVERGRQITFHVPDGSYQVFFYSGTGWNPNQQNPSASCSNLKGGFVNEEGVTKDKAITLYSQVMTYELIERVNGNFAAAPSSKGEAF